MPNDAKLGMLAGVLGVLVAAVVLGQPPKAPTDPEAAEKGGAPPGTHAVARSPPESPVARAQDGGPRPEPAAGSPTRDDVDARPASRQGTDEEP